VSKTSTWILATVTAAALALGGYWLGRSGRADHAPAAAAVVPAAKPQPRILYYRNPMGLPDTSPVPKKDPMGMDYVPVYEGEPQETPGAPGTVAISTEKVQKLGVRTEAAGFRDLTRTLRAAGIVEANERGLATIAPKFEGWIEKLHINTTGQRIGRGQALAEVYSPELVSAQREYLIARAGQDALANADAQARAGAEELASSAAARLRNWDISASQVERLSRMGEGRRTLTLSSPVAGVVIEKPAVQGMRFMPGEVLLRIADLSTVWLIAEVFEQDLAWAAVGQQAVVRFSAYPGRSFRGKVSFIYPTLNPQTRTARLRIDLANADGLLKPAMYGTVELAANTAARALAVPASAVIDSGERRIVLVSRGEGRFEPREVKTGTRADGYVEVREGIAAGEQVVVRANFLIDAESNLKAALGSFGHSGHGAAPTPRGEPEPQSAPPSSGGDTHQGH
jgi:RND family efflux transporter MFP subunit